MSDQTTRATVTHFRTLRERHGLTQQEVALAFGYTKTFVARIESGERRWRSVYWYGLCGLTGHDARDLEAGE